MSAAILAIWCTAIVGVAVAGAWKLGEGGGWLVFLAFLMVLAVSIEGNKS